MIPGPKGHVFHACMKSRTLGPAKHEKVDRSGRISNVFRITRARSVEQSVGIWGQKPSQTFGLVNLHSRHLQHSDAKHELTSSFMKMLVLRPRTLRPYVPLRLYLSESALRINMFCITSSFPKPVQIDDYYYINGLLTHHSYGIKN